MEGMYSYSYVIGVPLRYFFFLLSWNSLKTSRGGRDEPWPRCSDPSRSAVPGSNMANQNKARKYYRGFCVHHDTHKAISKKKSQALTSHYTFDENTEERNLRNPHFFAQDLLSADLCSANRCRLICCFFRRVCKYYLPVPLWRGCM